MDIMFVVAIQFIVVGNVQAVVINVVIVLDQYVSVVIASHVEIDRAYVAIYVKTIHVLAPAIMDIKEEQFLKMKKR